MRRFGAPRILRAMVPAPFRIGYVEKPMNAAFLDRLAPVPGIAVQRCDRTDDPAQALAGCHGYYVQAARDELPPEWHVTPALLAACPSLLVVASYGAGYDTIDLAACTAAGVAATNQAGGNAQGVAEHTLGLMLTLLKRVPEAQAAMRAGGAADRDIFMGRELHGRSVGLVGFGHVGRRVAHLLRLAFDCRVLAYDPYLPDADFAGVQRTGLPELLAESDIVSVHCPLTAETRGLFGAAAFAAMRPGAIFLTTARGGIHDEAALLAALQSGHLGGAGLDVWSPEPPLPDHPLLAHPAVLSSPHTAGVTLESRRRVAEYAADVFIAAAAGLPLPRMLNPDVAARYAERARRR